MLPSRFSIKSPSPGTWPPSMSEQVPHLPPWTSSRPSALGKNPVSRSSKNRLGLDVLSDVLSDLCPAAQVSGPTCPMFGAEPILRPPCKALCGSASCIKLFLPSLTSVMKKFSLSVPLFHPFLHVYLQLPSNPWHAQAGKPMLKILKNASTWYLDPLQVCSALTYSESCPQAMHFQ